MLKRRRKWRLFTIPNASKPNKKQFLLLFLISCYTHFSIYKIFKPKKKRIFILKSKNVSIFFFSAVLGSEYCSGYMDALGKWNTGFYCPNSDESSDVFCCGTEIHKYCCTKKDKVIQSEVQE